MVVAKTDAAHRALSEAFADHGRSGDLERAYQALVWGAPARNQGAIDAPLGRARDRVLRAVVPEGRDDARHADHPLLGAAALSARALPRPWPR